MTSPGIRRMMELAHQRRQELGEAAEKIVADFAHDGERDMEQIIEQSETETGRSRVANVTREPGGKTGSPGRIDTGLMINLVSSETDQSGSILSPGGAIYEGTFGWTKEAEEYFEYQERGTETIEPMHALQNSGIVNREAARTRIEQATRGN